MLAAPSNTSSQLEHAVQAPSSSVPERSSITQLRASAEPYSTLGDIFHFQMCMSSSAGAVFYRFSPLLQWIVQWPVGGFTLVSLTLI